MTTPLEISTVTVIDRVRKNHSLEHATMNILSKKYPGVQMAGHSNPNGFWIIGNIPTEALYEAVEEALTRLKNGEKQLAVHPFCGTNFAFAGMLSALAGSLPIIFSGNRTKDKLNALPFSMLISTLVLILTFPLGYRLQQNVTTKADVGDLEVVEILRNNSKRVAHRILTRG
ncbi:MAG: hypothetical protein JXA19_03780 [Anaerolineales bacterium]|nr:hypothetical protein [Anaerolineales bacterium]